MRKSLAYLRKAPRQKRAAATFEAIVEAAAHILRARGAKGLTTNAIALRAGVSIGSLYQYFPDKRAIVRALMEREFRFAEALRPGAIDGGTPGKVAVRALVDWHFDIRARDPVLWARLATLVAQTLPEAELAALALLREQRVARTVARLAGARVSGQLAHAAFIVDACLSTIADQTMLRHPERLASEALRREVTALLIGYLTPDP